jgi:hypothetical protein
VPQRVAQGILAMKAIRSITPREAKAVWDSLKSPSARTVARAMTQAGRRVHHSTIARWCSRNWRPVASGEHPIEAAREALDIAARLLTGDPEGGVGYTPVTVSVIHHAGEHGRADRHQPGARAG